MQEPHTDPFEDAPLKAAIKRAHPLDQAPANLRLQVTSLFTATHTPTLTSKAPTPSAPRTRLSSWRLASYALAACILLAGGALAILHFQPTPALPTPPQQVALLSDDMLKNLASTHRRCSSKASHHNFKPTLENDFPQLASSLGASDKLKHAVWAADLRKDGWEFKGASVCRLAQSQIHAAHFVFTKGDERLSVFTLKPDDLKAPSGASQFAQTLASDDAHCAISCFVQDGLVCAMVAESTSHEISATELNQIIANHKSQLIQPSETIALAENFDDDFD